jgi:hypothetical protein
MLVKKKTNIIDFSHTGTKHSQKKAKKFPNFFKGSADTEPQFSTK